MLIYIDCKYQYIWCQQHVKLVSSLAKKGQYDPGYPINVRNSTAEINKVHIGVLVFFQYKICLW